MCIYRRAVSGYQVYMDGFVVCRNFIVKQWNIAVCLKKETYLAQSGTQL